MRTKKLLVAGALLLSMALPAAAQAESDKHATLPPPGSKNCRGQAAAAVAQAGQHQNVDDAHGVGGVARFGDLSVKELNELIVAYCAGTP